MRAGGLHRPGQALHASEGHGNAVRFLGACADVPSLGGSATLAIVMELCRWASAALAAALQHCWGGECWLQQTLLCWCSCRARVLPGSHTYFVCDLLGDAALSVAALCRRGALHKLIRQARRVSRLPGPVKCGAQPPRTREQQQLRVRRLGAVSAWQCCW